MRPSRLVGERAGRETHSGARRRHAARGTGQARADGITPATINRYLSALRSAWNWGRTSGYLSANQVWPPRLLLTEAKGRTRHLSDQELAKLLETAQGLQPDHECCRHSIDRLRVAEGRTSSASLEPRRFRRGKLTSSCHEKRRIARRAPSSECGRNAARAQERDRYRASGLHYRKGRACGPGLDRAALATDSKTSGLEGFRWHDLRHSCASFLAASGASLLEIGIVLGPQVPDHHEALQPPGRHAPSHRPRSTRCEAEPGSGAARGDARARFAKVRACAATIQRLSISPTVRCTDYSRPPSGPRELFRARGFRQQIRADVRCRQGKRRRAFQGICQRPRGRETARIRAAMCVDPEANWTRFTSASAPDFCSRIFGAKWSNRIARRAAGHSPRRKFLRLREILGQARPKKRWQARYR